MHLYIIMKTFFYFYKSNSDNSNSSDINLNEFRSAYFWLLLAAL